MKRFKSVDEYIEAAEHWQPELVRLRKILLAAGLEETVKWGGPCYTVDGNNVVGLGAFKSYVGLWFFQGALLSDPEQVLINAQEGKTKALRQWRFKSAKQIKTRLVTPYLREAITLAKQGRQLKPSRGQPSEVPPPLAQGLADNKRAGACFASLTPGKQREYAEFIAEAKKEATKEKRLAKIMPMILAKQGLNDRYKS